MKTVLSFCSIVWLAASVAQAQFVIDCTCLAQQPGMHVTNCTATIPDLCAIVTNCFRGTVVPPPQIPPFQCSQTPTAGTLVGPGVYGITVTVQIAGVPPTQCLVPFQVIGPNAGQFTLQCAPNKTVNCDATWSFDPPTPLNPCCPNAAQPNGGVTITVTSTVTNGICPQVITRTWQGVDNCGQVATCSQTVTVIDITPPTINCGQNEVLNCGLGWGFTVPIISDNCTAPSDLVLSIVSTTTNFTCVPTFVATRIWKVTDLCGNSVNCTQVVTIVDFDLPTITCAPNKTVECGSGWTFDTPTASDYCTSFLGNGNVTIAVVSTTTNGTCPKVITRTWSATDGCGNVSQCSQTVTVVDTTPPVLDCACLQNPAVVQLTVTGCSNAIPDLCPFAIGPAPSCARDNCGPLTCSQSPATGTIVGPGVYPITVTVTDCAGNTASCVVKFTVLAPPDGCDTNCLPPPPNMVLWLPFDEATGITANNLAGGNIGNHFNGPIPTLNSYVANSLCFDGVDDYVEVTPYPAIQFGTGDFSVDAWVKPATLDSTIRIIVDHRAEIGGQAIGYSLFLGGLNTLGFQIGDGAYVSYPSTLTVPADGQWHLVAVTVNRSLTTGITFYLDGVAGVPLRDPTPYPGSITPPPGYPLRVSSRSSSLSGFFPGCIDEVELFNRALTAAEIRALYNAGSAGKCKTNCLPQSRVWNTGMGGPFGNVALAPGTPDPNYSLVSAPPGGCVGPAQVLNPASLPVGPWIANGPNSQWIGAGPTANCQEGVYHYRLCFDLPCTNGASIVGRWAVDDNATMFLNGQPTGDTIPSLQYPNLPGYGWFPVTITNGFVCGYNCLDFYVTNASIGINPTGFRAELMNVFNDCCCPAPRPIATVFSGMDPAGGPLPIGAPDPQFALTCAPAGVALTTPVAVTPHPNWVPNGPNSQWIGVDPSNFGPPGVYCYTLNFNIPCPPGVTIKASLTGQWTADDWAEMYLNGQPTGHTVPSIQFPSIGFNGWHPINITSGFVSGLNTLTFYVTNAGGPTGLRLELTNSASCCDCTNTNVCTVSVTCPSDIVRETCGNVAHIIYPLPTATSSCGLPVSVVCTPPSNTVFPLGTTPVTCIATDTLGNTASCNFKVIVLPDATPPVIDCTCLQAQLPHSVLACFAPIPNVCFAQCYSDNCTATAQLTCTQSPPAGTIVPGGASYIITVTVTDAAGNSAQCQVGFTVIAPTDTRVWNTGGTGSQAANFTVIQTPGGPANIPAVLTSPAGGAWSPNTAASSWVSFTPNSQNAAVGVYVYRLTFNLPCTNGASINGRFMSDDSARIWLNGVPTAALSTSFTAWTPVSLTSGFVSGLNTLDIYVTNAIIWTGLRTELTNTFNCCCPQAIALNCPRQALRGWVCGDGIANVPFNVTASSLCPSPGITVSVTCVPPSPGPFPVGTTTVNCTATDSLGNTTSCSFPVVVVSDTIPPVITCPGPITRVLCSNSVAVYYKVIAHDDCSPTVTVSCVPPSGTVFTAGTTIVTCTARDACGNTATCSFPVKVINNSIWQTLPIGINDCYAQSGWEPNFPGACLTTAYPGANWKNFDITTVNKWVGHTWNFPVSWNILAAQLATRARPPINGCSGISDNDSMSIGLANCTTPSWLWSRYLGSGNASPGLVQKQWCNGSDCQYLFNFDLALMPLTPSGTISLLPHMNSTKRLDLFFQDDTTVDFAHLRILRCAPSHVIGGIGVELASARLVYGPISWCLVRDTATTASFSARFSVGEADGLRLPIEPLILSDHPGSALALGEVDNSVPVDRLRVALQDDGSAVVSLGVLPAGVTHIDVEIEVNGEIVESFPNIPVTSGQPLVNFPGTEPLIELATANGNELLASILSQDPGQPAEKQTLRVRYLASSKRSEAELNLNVVGIPEIGVQTPELQTTLRESPTRPTKIRFSSSDGALAEVSGGQCVVNPLYEGSGQVSLNALFAPTDEFRAVTPPPFDTFSPAPANAVVRNIVRGLIGGEEVDVDQVEFTHVADGWDVSWSSAHVHPVRRIYYVYGPAGVHRFEVPGNGNLVVTVAELPTMTGKLGGRTPCRRQTWPKPTTIRIGGESFEATELRILVEVDNYPVTALTGLRLEAIGAESLMVSGLGVGPEEYRLETPELTPDGLWLRWTGFGGLLEEAPTVLGPWAPTPGQFEQTQGEVLTPHDPAIRSKFFHVRGL